jgi:hypothetical protein
VSHGANGGIKTMIKLLSNDTGMIQAGFMIPIPQYPFLLSAITEERSHAVRTFTDDYFNSLFS